MWQTVAQERATGCKMRTTAVCHREDQSSPHTHHEIFPQHLPFTKELAATGSSQERPNRASLPCLLWHAVGLTREGLIYPTPFLRIETRHSSRPPHPQQTERLSRDGRRA